MPESAHLDRAPEADEVFASVVELLAVIVGEDYLESLDVSPQTRFEADLELESMEIVQLAEELMARYGDQVDFVGWFGTMDLDQLIELSIGSLVSFIVTSLGGAGSPVHGEPTGEAAAS